MKKYALISDISFLERIKLIPQKFEIEYRDNIFILFFESEQIRNNAEEILYRGCND